jgi:hypothetical protein
MVPKLLMIVKGQLASVGALQVIGTQFVCQILLRPSYKLSKYFHVLRQMFAVIIQRCLEVGVF